MDNSLCCHSSNCGNILFVASVIKFCLLQIRKYPRQYQGIYPVAILVRMTVILLLIYEIFFCVSGLFAAKNHSPDLAYINRYFFVRVA